MLKSIFSAKLFLLLLILFVSTAFCFAKPSFEFSIDYSCLTECSSSVEFTGNGIFHNYHEGSLQKKISSPAGLGGSATVFLGSPFKSLDVGIGSAVCYHLFSKCMLEDEDVKVDNGYVFSVEAGPAARLSFGKYTSLYVCPGVRFNLQNIKIKTDAGAMRYKEKNIMVNVSLGLREWLFSTSKTSLGLDAGFDFAMPLNSFSDVEYSGNGTTLTENYKVTSGRLLKFYVGMCVNLGNRNAQ
ncbi:MAG: hypothetical protein IJ828_01675 [Treponema sp.]|nr:hypothetical protein [Treponema sp.]